LNPGSLRTSSSGGWEETKQFIDAQIRLYDKTCAGFFFWTFKKQHPGDFGWSLRDAVGAGTFPDRIGLRSTIPGRVIEPDDIARAKSTIMNVACGKIQDVCSFTFIDGAQKIIESGGHNSLAITNTGNSTTVSAKDGMRPYGFSCLILVGTIRLQN